jgi:DNA-binding CsgD family transcriptional regulator
MLAGSLREDAKLIDRGVQVRAIYPHALLQNAKYARYLHDLSELGAEVRLLGHAPCDLLIFDRTFASLPADPADRDGGAILMIRGSALAASYLAFYEDFWLRAVPYEKAAGNGPPSGAELTPQERTVIRLMAGGLTDDQIARKMGVHRRTVQRAVSKLMERLHASSRFEAGLKLAQDPEFARTLRGAPSAQPPSTRARSSSASAEAGSAAPASGAAGHAASAPPASGAAGPPDPPPSAPPAGSPPAPSAAAPGAAVPGAAAHAAGRPG